MHHFLLPSTLNSPPYVLEYILISEEEVEPLKTGKATGQDSVNNRLLREKLLTHYRLLFLISSTIPSLVVLYLVNGRKPM